MFLSGKKRWILLTVVTSIGFFLDWLTKTIVINKLPLGRPVSVIGDYFQLVFVYNTGAIFGINPRNFVPWFPVNLFFYIFSVIAIVMLIFYYKELKSDKAISYWGISLIMPGAIGNLFDRIIRPDTGVVDFIRLGIPDVFYWAIFNFADMYITFGVAFILYEFMREGLLKKRLSERLVDSSSGNL